MVVIQWRLWAKTKGAQAPSFVTTHDFLQRKHKYLIFGIFQILEN